MAGRTDMAKGAPVRSVARHLYANYLGRARQFLQAARGEASHGAWDSCVLMAVHSAISAADALCVFTLGVRNSSDRHADAVSLLRSIEPKSADLQQAATRLGRILDSKNPFEYGETLAREKDARSVVLDAERFLSFIEHELGKRGAE